MNWDYKFKNKIPKIALIVYHKNMNLIYPEQWIDTFKFYIDNQTYKWFDIFEVNYGGTSERIFENSDFEIIDMPTFVHAMNYLLDKCYNLGYDYVANSNVDDWFDRAKFEWQIEYMDEGFDIISSNFILVKEKEIFPLNRFDKLNIKEELDKNHNIVCHPSVCYSRSFLETNRYVPEDIPYEDLLLWKKTVGDFKFVIAKENLLYHRLHNQSVCQSQNR